MKKQSFIRLLIVILLIGAGFLVLASTRSRVQIAQSDCPSQNANDHSHASEFFLESLFRSPFWTLLSSRSSTVLNIYALSCVVGVPGPWSPGLPSGRVGADLDFFYQAKKVGQSAARAEMIKRLWSNHKASSPWSRARNKIYLPCNIFIPSPV